ncbi:Endonuclease V [bacterium HR29]|jgi:deoxyribonuclease V|nr:Endonuclease V [bacterium HR29]
MSGAWPETAEALEAEQRRLASLAPAPWQPGGRLAAAGVFVCFERGVPGQLERGWAAAAVFDVERGRILGTALVSGRAAAPYEPGFLALREGPLLEAAVRALRLPFDVLLVDATGRDHPRRAGLALHLGAVLDLPTVGVTHRPLLAAGSWPPPERGASSPLFLEGEIVGYWLRTAAGARPLAVHAAWRTAPETAVEVVLRCSRSARTPEPLRAARRAAREARASFERAGQPQFADSSREAGI